jgi:RNA polymerase sigma-70 factor (ECF subfamily)
MSSPIQTQGTAEVHPDVLLVERARAGDVAAYEKLVKQYDRQVFRIAQHIVQNREDAEDVVQDAFLKAYEKLDQFQGNSKFYTWLVRIAVNESLMRLRKRRTGKMVSIDEDVETEEGSMPRDLADWSPDPEAMYGQSEMADILRKTINGVCASRRRWAFDRGNGGDAGVEYSGGKIPIAAGAIAAAGAVEPVF